MHINSIFYFLFIYIYILFSIFFLLFSFFVLRVRFHNKYIYIAVSSELLQYSITQQQE